MNIEWLNWQLDWQSIWIVLVKMLLALVCGGVLGIERGRKKRPAGFRTYMLVCLGATLVMMTNEYICGITGNGDMARMGAQVVNGIGFLGAGTIITTGHNRVKGLTTAAGLWAAACIGLAIGSGYYEGAIFGTLMIFIIMVVLHNFDRRMIATAKVVILYVELEKMSVIKKLVNFARENQISIDDVEVEHPDEAVSSKVAAVLTIKLPAKGEHESLVEKMATIDGVIFVEEL